MNNYTLTDVHGQTWVRVNATKAKNLFNQGETITVCPCKVNPFNPFYCMGCEVHNNEEFEFYYGTFDKFINSYSFYNCYDNEWGYYPAYYVKSEIL